MWCGVLYHFIRNMFTSTHYTIHSCFQLSPRWVFVVLEWIKIATRQKDEECESLYRSGARGEVRGGVAITGSDEGESALLAAVSFMSETGKDSQRKKWHERGTVRVKEKSASHLKGLWGWHLHILRLSPFANIPRPQKTLSLSYLMLFCSVLLRQTVLQRKIPLVYYGHTTIDSCSGGSTAEDLSSHSGNHFPVYLLCIKNMRCH